MKQLTIDHYSSKEEKTGVVMFWLDLGLCCLLLWGAMAGYLAGWRRATRHLGALFITIAVAAAVKGDMRSFLSRHYPVEEVMQALTSNRLAVPVDGSVTACRAALAELGLPRVIQLSVINDFAALATPDLSRLVEMVAQVMFNTLSFLILLILWWGFFHLVALLFPVRQEKSLNRLDRWGGFLSGLFRQSLLLILAVGVLAPFAWLPALPTELFDLEAANLTRWGMLVFNYTGLWWK